MNKKQLAEQARKAYDAELAKGAAADQAALKTLEADWKAKQAEADKEDTKALVLDDTALTSMITKAVSTEIDKLKEKFASVPTVKDIEAIVTKSISEAADKANVEAISAKAMQDVFAGCKRATKFAAGGGQVELPAGGQIEIPTSYTGSEANLPLHAKQLFNIVMCRFTGQTTQINEDVMNKGIPEDMLRQGRKNGESYLSKMQDSAREYQREALATPDGNWKTGAKAFRGAHGKAVGDAYTTTSTDGTNLVAIELSSQLQRRFYLQTELASLMASREIDMPVENYPFPLVTTLPQMHVGATQNLVGYQNAPGTGQPTLSSKKLMGEIQYSYEADAASIIRLLPMMEEMAALSAAHAFERALINGDGTSSGTGATVGSSQHFDYDVVDDSDGTTLYKRAERTWNGLRYFALNATPVAGVNPLTVSGGGIAAGYDLFAQMQLAMGKYGLNPKALVWIVGPKGTRRMKSVSQVQTAYAFGESRATIITGDIEQYEGIPVVKSEYMREDVDATGINSVGGPNTLGSVLLVRPDRFLVGRRQVFMVEIFRQIWTQTNRVVFSFRRAFTPVETPSATVPSVVNGVNWQ